MIRITDDEGRVSTVIPLDWEYDTAPHDNGQALVAGWPGPGSPTFDGVISLNLGTFTGVAADDLEDTYLEFVEIGDWSSKCEAVSDIEPTAHEAISVGFVLTATGCGQDKVDALFMMGIGTDGDLGYLLDANNPPGQEWTAQLAFEHLRGP